MSDMPERIWAFRWPEGRRTWRDETMFAPDFAVEYRLADAPLTPAEALARCPEVAALVATVQDCEDGLGGSVEVDLLTAIAPFTEGPNG